MFYQKNIRRAASGWIKTFPVTHEKGKIIRYVIADDVETLVWLGNQACLGVHPWLSSIDAIEQPDFAVFDLDPMGKSTFIQVCWQVNEQLPDITTMKRAVEKRQGKIYLDYLQNVCGKILALILNYPLNIMNEGIMFSLR